MSHLSRLRSRRMAALTTATAVTLALTACSNPGQSEDPTEETSTVPATSSAPETTETTTTSSEATTSHRSSTSKSTTTSSAREGVEAARKVFPQIAPASLWEHFDTCIPTGLEGSFECSGSKVGSFQLFDSKSKAVSTTQLLTELRSSEVVADTGRFVVGWSTLGTTAVITVVDNDEGQVMQQLVSSDIEEPDEKIEELGLAHPPYGSSTTDEPTTSSAGRS